MKKIILFAFIISLFLFFPTKVSAVSYSCTTSGGKKVCYYSYQVNDPDFRYSISKVTKNGTSGLTLWGWGFLYNASSYSGSSNRYAVEVIYNGNVIKTYNAYTYSFAPVSCYHFQKASSKIDNNECMYQSQYSSFPSWIFSNNIKYPNALNSVYDYIGFSTTINLDEINTLIAAKANLTCPKSTHPACVKNNCGGVASEKNENNNNLCSFTKEGSFKFYLRLKLIAPSGAVRNSDRVFYKNISIYNDTNIISSAVRSYINTKGMTISTNNYSSAVATRVDAGYVRSGPGLNDSPIKDSGKNVYVPWYGWYTPTYTTYRRTLVASTAGGNITLNKILIYGYVTKGCGHSNTSCNDRVLMPDSTSRSGYISESWTYPSNPVTYIDTKIKKNCKCERTPVSFNEGAEVPSSCSNDAKTATKNDTLKVDDTIDVSTATALNIMLKGDNSSFATQSQYQGMSFNVGKLKEVQDNFNYSSDNNYPVYCMLERNFKLYGKNDIYGAITQGKDEEKIYAGRYYRIKKDKMTADITKKCVTNPGCESTINNIANSSTITYDLSYKPDNTLKTKMINGSEDEDKEVKITSVSSPTQISKTIQSKYEMRNDQTYYYDYKMGDVSLSETDFLIPGRNIYPVPVKTTTNNNYDIRVTVKGNKKTNGNSDTDFTYTCSYMPIGKDNGTPDDSGKKNNTNYYYRTIGLKNVFPNNRKASYNWSNANAQKVKEEIESNGENIYSKNPKYSVIINTAQMREIRKYNNSLESSGGYMDYSLKCTTTNDVRTCYSKFLNNIVTKGYAEEFKRGDN